MLFASRAVPSLLKQRAFFFPFLFPRLRKAAVTISGLPRRRVPQLPVREPEASRPQCSGATPAQAAIDRVQPGGRMTPECPQPSCLACHFALPCPRKMGRAIGPSSAAGTAPWSSLPFLTPYCLSVPVGWWGLAVTYFFSCLLASWLLINRGF